MMRNPNPSSLVLHQILIIQLIILFSTNTGNLVEAGFFTKDATVKVYNDVGPGITVVLQCKSIDGVDLGVHYLGYKQHFDWTFNLSIYGDTRYMCDANWNNGERKYFAAFDMLRVNDDRGHKDYDMCEPCAWRVTDEGAYRYDNRLNYETWKRFYGWDD